MRARINLRLKLLEALNIINQPVPAGARKFSVFLASGFTPLHLERFLAAHLRGEHPERDIQIKIGVFGDLAGNIDAVRAGDADAIVAAIEWQDLDPRLGIRTLGGWTAAALPDILESVRAQLARLASRIESITGVPIVLAGPTLPLPPVSYFPTTQASPFELELRSALASFYASAARHVGVRCVSAQTLDERSPTAARFDVKSDLLTGFPYTQEHADALAGLLARAARNPPPKKGLITDLDDTLWRGIVGEAGVSGISWALDDKAQMYGLYQQLLASLASSGTLIGVASKNDLRIVEEVFRRTDILLPQASVFPVEAHWQPKSESIGRILQKWNIGADAVVFVDDSPMEVAEVQAAFPEMECLVLPKDDAGVWRMLHHLREVFGKTFVSEEDRVRLDSLRSGAELQNAAVGSSDLDGFLAKTDAEITFTVTKNPDRRAFELINKTNQFNINGIRLTEVEYANFLRDPETFIVKVDYKDRFGPLGTIGVVAGRRADDKISVEHWVLSCRAFSRRIEHRSLEWLFDRYQASEVAVRFAATPRNGPVQEFLAAMLSHGSLDGNVAISREAFAAACPPLSHRVHTTIET